MTSQNKYTKLQFNRNFIKHTQKCFMFRLGTSSEKKDPNQLFPIKSNLKKKPLVIENSMSVIINIDSHIIQ